ncbi:hypothetical protein LSAT2_021134 [Lamellibrachia satsuma]|nr:hypothetical protein LSAT2_021134 [Lamellibrachia satsuma]
MLRRDTEGKKHFAVRRSASPCQTADDASDTEKAAMQITYNLHQHNKDLLWKNKEEDDKKRGKTNAELSVACFNLQQVLNGPNGEVSNFYYRRKLSA